jgi:type I restriction enzyme S subunit
LMYLSNTEMQKSRYDSAHFMSKKFLPSIKEQKLKKGDIILSAVGTIGQVAVVSELLENSVISGNILRFTPKENYGYIYAYLQSKFGQANLVNIASGSVQDFITPPKLSEFRIPTLSIENDVHTLVLEATSLSVEANKSLNKAIELFESFIGLSKVHTKFQSGFVTSRVLTGRYKRLDGQYHLLKKALKEEEKKNIKYQKIVDMADSIFVGGRGKRIYVEKGVPFLSSSDMMLYNPKRNCKKVSKQTPGITDMIVSKKDILISRSGTVGNTVLVGDDLAGTAISEHALRLVIDSAKISPNYVFCFLKTKYGMKSMEASSFGSVIITLNEDLIGNINLPLLDQESQDKINQLTESYLAKMDEATTKENQAIDLVEKEIYSWQK